MHFRRLHKWLNRTKGNWLLFGFGLAVQVLTVWMIVEALAIWRKARGVLEPGAGR
jgi:hypothetical protein